MKRLYKNILIGTISAVGLLLISGCSSATISADTMKKYAEKNEVVFFDSTSMVSEDFDYILGIYTLDNPDSYHVELWELKSTDNAENWYEQHVKVVDDMEPSTTIASESGYDYTGTADDIYYRVIVNDTKCIFAYGNEEDVDKVLKDLHIEE